MTAMDSIVLKPFEEEHLSSSVQIHLNGLGYTFNSLLGADHLAYVYRTMARSRDAYVGVALYKDQPVGVISGTLNMDATKSVLLRSSTFGQLIHLAFQMLVRPRLIHEWQKGNVISRPVYVDGTPVKALLSTIVVDSNYHGKGIGKCLVDALEDFFKSKKVHRYRLDTLISNQGAREFYKRLGFRQVETRADSIVFIKELTA